MASFEIIRGTSKLLTAGLVDGNSAAIDLTGASTVKLGISPTVDIAESDLVLDAAMSIASPATSGTVLYAFQPSDTSSLVAGMYQAEIMVTYTDGSILKTDPPFQFTIKDPVRAP